MSGAREFFLLFKMHLHMRLGLSALKDQRRTGKGKAKQIGFLFLALYVVAALWLSVGLLLNAILGPAIELGLGNLLFGIGIFACMAMVLVLGTLSLLGLVFGARDTELYAALPVRPRSVFLAKFSMVYLTELAFLLFLLVPIGVLFGTGMGLGWTFYARLLLAALVIPVVPLALSSILVMPLMRLVTLSKRRDMFMLIISIAFMLLMVFGQLILSSQSGRLMGDPSQAMALLTDSEAMLRAMLRYFPPALWAESVIMGGGAGAAVDALKLLFTCAASLTLALLLSSKLYYRGALAQLEAAKSGRSKRYKKASVKAGSPFRAFFFKELKLLLRTPIYAMNQLTGVIIFPIMLIGLKLTSGEGFDGMLGLVFSGGRNVSAVLTLAAFMAFVTLVNPGASTLFSREGRSVWITQTVPVPIATQLSGRLLCLQMFGVVGVLALGCASVFVLGRSVDVVLAAVLIALSCVVPVTNASALPDCIHPKLKWNSEAEAMKQNVNSLIGMLCGLLALAPCVLAAVLMLYLEVGVALTTLCLVVINAVLSFLVTALVNRRAERMLNDLQ